MPLKTSLISCVFILGLSVAVILSYRYESQFQKVPFINTIIQQRFEARQAAKINRLNIYMIRNYQTLFETILPASGPAHLDDYIQYFQLIRDYLPTQADGYSLVGYCLARSNQVSQAIEQYKKALVVNPSFFWSYYNLGLLLWLEGDFSNASMVLQKALHLNPQETLSAIASSKVYRDILSGAEFKFDVVKSLENGYRKIPLFLEMIDQKKSIQLEEIPLKFL